MTHPANLRSQLSGLRSRLRAFRDGRDGMAAAEFALVLPLLIALWAGVATAGQVESRSTAVNNAAATLADMVAQEGGGDAPTVMRALEATFHASDRGKVYLKVTRVRIPSQSEGGEPYVVWWYDNRGGRGGRGGEYPLPPNMKIKGNVARHLMIADGQLSFTPTFGSKITGTFDITHRAIFAPRNST